jgi:hypothetical protein
MLWNRPQKHPLSPYGMAVHFTGRVVFPGGIGPIKMAFTQICYDFPQLVPYCWIEAQIGPMGVETIYCWLNIPLCGFLMLLLKTCWGGYNFEDFGNPLRN